MKRFRELTIAGSTVALRDLVSVLSKILPSNWQRDSTAESRLVGVAGPEVEGFAFARTADTDIPATGLLLVLEGDRLRVPNIVPRESGQISVDQYNAILVEFAHIIDTLLEEYPGLNLEISDEDVGITEWISLESAELLKRFSVLANMSTGSSHPSDFSRWASFIIKTHKEGSQLYPDDLKQWLIEELQWPLEKAETLSLEYEFAIKLLAAYDRNQA